jgi:hypothetical protein
MTIAQISSDLTDSSEKSRKTPAISNVWNRQKNRRQACNIDHYYAGLPYIER